MTSYDISLNPHYNLYHESEARIFNVASSGKLLYNGINRKRVNGSETQKSTSDKIDTRFDIDLSLKEYVADNIFLLMAGDATFDYIRNLDKNTENRDLISKTISIERNIRTSPRFGFGFGRIRNVNPVIRAVRLDERLRAVGRDASLGSNDILSAADQFTRYQGYQATYDRPDKYFWGDMNRATSSALSGVSPYDMMYLTDVLDEAIGSRLQGWEVLTGASFHYNNSLARKGETETSPLGQVLDRSSDINKSISLFLRGRWYQNISLNHQVGIFSYINQQYPLDSSLTLWYASIRVGGDWLWNVADRWLLRTEFQNIYLRHKRENRFKSWRNSMILGSNISYFIENQLAIHARISARLEHSGNNREKLNGRNLSLSFSAGMRYYFARNIY